MPVIAEDKRVATLRRWGVSEPLIRLSCGDDLHEQFGISCKGPPWYVYRGHLEAPNGVRLAALWEGNEQVTGVWRRGGRLEFIRFDFGEPDEYKVLANTEQGFWVRHFDFFYECDDPLEKLRGAAAVVGFRFFDRWWTARQTLGKNRVNFETHQEWLLALIAEIDQEIAVL